MRGGRGRQNPEILKSWRSGCHPLSVPGFQVSRFSSPLPTPRRQSMALVGHQAVVADSETRTAIRYFKNSPISARSLQLSLGCGRRRQGRGLIGQLADSGYKVFSLSETRRRNELVLLVV